MRPAMLAVRARMQAHEWPTGAEVRAMLVESACDPIESVRLAADYTAARPDEPSGESQVLDAFRTYSQRWPIC